MFGVFVGGGIMPIEGALTGTDFRTDGSSSHIFPTSVVDDNIAIGDAAADRRIVTVWSFSTNQERTVSSCTIRGVTATVHIHAKAQDDEFLAKHWANVVIASAIVPTGTELIGGSSATDARLNLSGISGSGNGAYCAFYRLIGADTVVTDEDGLVNDSTNLLACALAVQAGDFLLGGVCGNHTPSDIALSGLTLGGQQLENDTLHAHGYFSAPSTNPTYALGAELTGGFRSAAMAVAAFRA